MKLTFDQVQQRYAEIPSPIANLQYENLFIHRIIQSYASGDIITLQEALCQIIIGLAINWTEQQKRMCELALMETPTGIKKEELHKYGLKS